MCNVGSFWGGCREYQQSSHIWFQTYHQCIQSLFLFVSSIFLYLTSPMMNGFFFDELAPKIFVYFVASFDLVTRTIMKTSKILRSYFLQISQNLSELNILSPGSHPPVVDSKMILGLMELQQWQLNLSLRIQQTIALCLVHKVHKRNMI